MGMAIVTSVSKNYVPLARVLMRSVERWHPEADRYVVLIDTDEDVQLPATTIRTSELLPDPQELLIQQTIYKPIEFATALKPKVLTHLLREYETVFFLDPDMRLFAPMTDAIKLLEGGTGTLLTPHRNTPPPAENADFYEYTLKAYGTYNLGFIGVTAAATPFLEWWDSRLRRDCLDDLPRTHWVDQRIVDLAPGYFELDLLRHPGYNVGWWNLQERPLSKQGDSWDAGSGPLVLMHYSGVRPIKGRGDLPQLVHSPRNEVAHDPAQLALIQELEDGYVADLQKEGYAELAGLPYGLARTAGGNELTNELRRQYLSVVLAAEQEGRRPPWPDEIPWDVVTRTKTGIRNLTFPGALLRDARKSRRLASLVRTVDRVRARRAG